MYTKLILLKKGAAGVRPNGITEGAVPLAANSGLRKEGAEPHLSGQINVAEVATKTEGAIPLIVKDLIVDHPTEGDRKSVLTLTGRMEIPSDANLVTRCGTCYKIVQTVGKT